MIIRLFLIFSFLFSCSDSYNHYENNLSILKETVFLINNYFENDSISDSIIANYYDNDFVFNYYPVGFEKGKRISKSDYFKILKSMKLKQQNLNIFHSIYLPGIDEKTFKTDCSVRVYYGASIDVDTTQVKFSGYQTINFKNGKILEVWEWLDYTGVFLNLEKNTRSK